MLPTGEVEHSTPYCLCYRIETVIRMVALIDMSIGLIATNLISDWRTIPFSILYIVFASSGIVSTYGIDPRPAKIFFYFKFITAIFWTVLIIIVACSTTEICKIEDFSSLFPATGANCVTNLRLVCIFLLIMSTFFNSWCCSIIRYFIKMFPRRKIIEGCNTHGFTSKILKKRRLYYSDPTFGVQMKENERKRLLPLPGQIIDRQSQPYSTTYGSIEMQSLEQNVQYGSIVIQTV